MADEISKNGVFVDTATGKVVEKEPEQGIQLVAPGDEITDDVQQMIDRYKSDSSGPVDAVSTKTTKK